MHHGPPSSSSRKAALLVLSSLLGMAGCSGAKLLAPAPGADPLRLATVDTGQALSNAVPRQSDDEIIVADLMPTASTAPATAGAQPAPLIVAQAPVPASGPAELQVAGNGRELGMSAWCEYLKEDTAAEATVLRSPTLNGSVDDGGTANVNLGLSLTSFHKANLLEQAAEARCRRHLAELGLQKLIFISPQGLTAAGFRAKHESIQASASEIAGLRGEVRRELSIGAIDADTAAAFFVQADQLEAEGFSARSQADRRFGAEGALAADAGQLGSELLQAESDLSDIDGRIRTADAMDVSVHAGWSEDDVGDGVERFDDGFSGKVSFSMKLGALAPSRFAHQNRARDAKIEAIRSQEGGILWQVATLRRAHERAIAGLVASRSRFDQALLEARGLAAQLQSVSNPEFSGQRLSVRLKILQLEAEKAAVIGSIAEIEDNMQQLGQPMGPG